jgi:hypothetical protein
MDRKNCSDAKQRKRQNSSTCADESLHESKSNDNIIDDCYYCAICEGYFYAKMVCNVT